MPTDTLTQAEEAAVALEKAGQLAAEAATEWADVVSICKEPDGELVPVDVALALLGRAYIARRMALWSVEEADNAIAQLVQQVHLAEEHVEFAHIDVEADDA